MKAVSAQRQKWLQRKKYLQKITGGAREREEKTQSSERGRERELVTCINGI